MDQPGKVANLARGQLNTGKMNISLSVPIIDSRYPSSKTPSLIRGIHPVGVGKKGAY